ncbi:MAG: EAL domain-containing protein [Eubacterium sp.]|nr:EAL domain-containing protein [Eubacterium sp.]
MRKLLYVIYQNTRSREKGDANIFNLIDYSLFDGVIVLSDMIQTPGVENAIQEKIHSCYSGPVVCVDTESAYFTTFWTDGYKAVYDTVSHMIEEHGMKDIAYLTGRKEHVHSIRRLEAYRAAMEAHGLPVREDRIFYGDFWYFCGTACAEELLRDREHLPEAVICANDPMAIGVAIGMERAGVRIPEDIAIVGYGTSEEGRKSPCPITSPWIPGAYYGGFAVETIFGLMKGEKPAETDPETTFFTGESCGCKMKEVDPALSRRSEWATGNSDGGFQSLHDYLMEDMLLSESLEDFFRTVYDYVYFLNGVRRMDIYLDEQWKYPEQLVKNMFLTDGYPEKMLHIMSYDIDHSGESVGRTGKTIETAAFLKDMESERPEGHFILPLFFENKTFGFAVFSYGNIARSYDTVVRFWMYSVCRGLEALRRTIALRSFSLLMTPDLEPKFPLPDEDFDRDPNGNGLTEEEREIRDEVGRILDDNRLTYHFQPIVRAEDGEIYSYEALMRSGSERKISPLQIIRFANSLGRLRDIEKATFLNVLGIVDERNELFGDRKIFINSIPGIRLKYGDQMLVDDLLRKHAQQVVVELTEQAELEDDKLEELKTHLRELGSGVAVDDYGTGYSNVSNLLRYMPNCVKIDRSLLSEIQSNSQKQHFVRNIIEFCHENNILALAEGVETREELQTVIRLGADLIQGFYVARPSAEIVSSVDSALKMEICRFYRERLDGLSDQVYIAGKTPRITMNTLIKEDKTTIIIGEKGATSRDVTIAGNPNVSSNIHIEVMEGYDGTVTLENVTLSNQKQRPCIRMAENASLRIKLIGENRLEGGGILVPESSTLTLEGEGNLRLRLNGTELFGIGNEIGRRHGTLDFYQDGEVSIESTGKSMVGIGSGLGGPIGIHKGRYSIYMSGSEGVGIGSVFGNEDIQIHDCDLFMDYSFREGVCIGSTYGNARIEAMRALLRFNCGGTKITTIGSIKGDKAAILLHDLSVHINLRSDSSTAFGSQEGASDIDVCSVAIRYKFAGKDARVFGGLNPNSEIHMDDADLRVEMKTIRGTLTNAPEDRCHIERSMVNVEIDADE